MSHDYRQTGHRMGGRGREGLVDAVAAYHHANESIHMHENVGSDKPCAYCWLRAGRAVQVLAQQGALLDGPLAEDDLPDEDACWEWPGARDRDGYGVKTYQGRQWRVHRLAYMQATGEDPGELHVLHACDNPPCYRPSHLRVGTNAENVADKVERGRARNQYTDTEACIYGHPFTPENTYTNPASGNRQCRTCRRLFNALDKKLAKTPRATKQIFREVFRERLKQSFVWGEHDQPDGTGGGRALDALKAVMNQVESNASNGTTTWYDALKARVFAALAEEDPAKLRAQLVQVAAVAVSWAGAIDQRSAGQGPVGES